MAPNYSKNAILEGCVPSDFFCLVCEQYFTSSAKCNEHISGEDHKSQMLVVKTVEDYKEDSIKKIKNKYFCELCNKLFSIFARVKMHVFEKSHVQKKYTGWLKRFDNVVVAFDSILIDDTSWQGLCDNCCAVCNTEYKDEEAHKNLTSHKMNLIQSKVEFDKHKNIFRKVDDHSMQCLTCNLVQTYKTNHFESSQHKQMFQVACDVYKTLEQANFYLPDSNNQVSEQVETRSINNDDHTEKSIVKSTYVYDDKAEEKIFKILSVNSYISYDQNKMNWCILCDWVMDISRAKDHINGVHHQSILYMHKKRAAELLMKNSDMCDDNNVDKEKILEGSCGFENDDIKMNLELHSAICKKCSANLTSDCEILKIIENHLIGKEKKIKKKKKTVKFLFKDDVADNNITLFSSIESVRHDGHVAESSEGSTNESANDTASGGNPINTETPRSPKIIKIRDPTLEKIPLTDFIESIVGVKNIIFKDLIINETICVNHFSFFFVSFLSGRVTMKCYICSETIFYTEFESHNTSLKHETAMKDTLVLTQCDGEFVREMRPGFFHCGYCNIFQTPWNEMERHLTSSYHIECKNDALWRLQKYQPELAKNTLMKTVVDKLSPNILSVTLI